MNKFPVLINQDDVRWGFFPRPTSGVDGAFIQTIATARFIDSGTDRSFDGQIVPEVNFNCYRKKAPGGNTPGGMNYLKKSFPTAR